MRKNRILNSAFLIAGLAALSACTLYEETGVSQSRLQVVEHKYAERVPVSDLSEDYVDVMAKRYHGHGVGQATVTILYDAHRPGAAKNASYEAARLAEALSMRGVDDIHAGILPVDWLEHGPEAIVSYASFDAEPPPDCTVMAGLRDRNLDLDPDYKLGCSIETVFAKQIARPKDLLGQGQNDPTSDGRSASNIVEVYRTGAPNEPLEGETASDN